MVIPWVGIPLSEHPQARRAARRRPTFVEFTTLLRPSEMPGQQRASLEWPYVEGLRMDEAMHPLTIIAVGLYGKTLMNQNGAPIRLVVPWKYGFKSIKSIVRIRFVDKHADDGVERSPTRANTGSIRTSTRRSIIRAGARRRERRHRRASSRRPTLMFNGYGDQVASMYAGMDLKKYY